MTWIWIGLDPVMFNNVMERVGFGRVLNVDRRPTLHALRTELSFLVMSFSIQ